MGAQATKSIYFENDDILQIRVSDKPIVREESQDWHTNISYAEDGSIVELFCLMRARRGCCLLNSGKRLESTNIDEQLNSKKPALQAIVAKLHA